jgi:two-component system sensor histidine kinase DegS
MNPGPYTRDQMDATRTGAEPRDAKSPDAQPTDAAPRDAHFDGLHAEAKAALGSSANALRSVRERYREAYLEELARWQALRDELDALARSTSAAEGGADDATLRTLRAEVDALTTVLGEHQGELSKLELVHRSLENTWLFLERGDASLVAGEDQPTLATDIQMRIVEAQEGERSRLAQEIHDGPAQALSNAIFQVEYIERVVDQDPRVARTELRFLRELLRRELGDVRSYISQLRPPRLMELGLDGAISESAETFTTLTGVAVETDLAAPPDVLDEASQTVALRIVQEALQNVRKHASATRVRVTTRIDGEDWLVEVRDDGRGFDPDTVATRGRRNFGLQFMRERAELIGARFGVRSRPDGGTIVTLGIPMGGERG